ncbi:uncharacterized protein WM294_008825 isoform 1-T2 [Sarcoramphus papa]
MHPISCPSQTRCDFVTLQVLRAVSSCLCLQRWLVLWQHGLMQPMAPSVLPTRQPCLTTLLLWLLKAFAPSEHPWVQCCAPKYCCHSSCHTAGGGDEEGCFPLRVEVLCSRILFSCGQAKWKDCKVPQRGAE